VVVDDENTNHAEDDLTIAYLAGRAKGYEEGRKEALLSTLIEISSQAVTVCN
jgi:hypothetical protein